MGTEGAAKLKYRIIILLIVAALLFAEEQHPNVSVELVPLVEHVIPGEELELAVVFDMLDDWHIYWQNPGDAGMATMFNWQLPDDVQILNKQEPAPSRLTEEGITTFIHDDEAIYLFTLTTPSDLTDTMTIDLTVDWLECKSICLPGSAVLQVVLPVSNEPHDLPLDIIDLRMDAHSRMPVELEGLAKKARIEGDELSLRLRGFRDVKRIDFFPADELVFDIQTAPRLKRGLLGRKLILSLLPERDADPLAVRGVLAIKPATPKGAKTQYFQINQSILP
ncbi:MAG: hypothetical protein K9M49_02095 [Candidatus Marinimicrobia bacterium]|nr:hypothetical protein [Candidatus Neomarinimicrobiota bacterium]MCF7903922.1 hypothetical protein [Candidatus Neomarinimicrobiota bacterium]